MAPWKISVPEASFEVQFWFQRMLWNRLQDVNISLKGAVSNILTQSLMECRNRVKDGGSTNSHPQHVQAIRLTTSNG